MPFQVGVGLQDAAVVFVARKSILVNQKDDRHEDDDHEEIDEHQDKRKETKQPDNSERRKHLHEETESCGEC